MPEKGEMDSEGRGKILDEKFGRKEKTTLLCELLNELN